MSIPISEKLKLIRESERLNRRQFSELTGVIYSTLSGYEAGTKSASLEPIMKIF
ncbi:helix-turn-helix domain-containing protein, partial [Klebsiella pneumoniae]